MSRIVSFFVAFAFVVSLAPHSSAADGRARPVCPHVSAGRMRCLAEMRPAATPAGLSPARVKSAYRFTTDPRAGEGETVAVVAAYNDPHAEADLNAFSKRFGLPSCTRSTGCFRKVDETGRTNRFPVTEAGWALEISMDVQWVHAIAPSAKILLVEADDPTMTHLMRAVDYAKGHARYVSNSWGGPEFSTQRNYDGHFTGATFFFSSGDDGAGAEYPTSSPKVISVGGTSLGANNSETGWSGSGGGCSHYEQAAPAQASFSQIAPMGCGGRRATPDLALVADPSPGVAVYDSTPFDGTQGWFTLGGTSASAPIAAGHAATTHKAVTASTIYGSSLRFRDITSGNNGYPCRTGFDMVTGRGSWLGA